MGKDKKSGLSASSKKIDPTLDALFSTSSGPVQAPPKSRYSELIPENARRELERESEDEDEVEVDDEELSSGDEGDANESEASEVDEAADSVRDEELSDASAPGASEDDEREIAAQILAEAQAHERKQKKKRKQDEFHDLESKYFDKLGEDEPPASKRRKSDDNGAEDSKAKDAEDDSDGDIPVHESLTKSKEADEIEKASRTVFLSNVSIEAASSKKAKKTLTSHLSSFLDKSASPPQSLESLRFRSVPFATAAMPKRAAFATKNLMEATTQSVNAYVVYSSAAVARAACEKLNGTVVLDRHLRVDSVAHPAAVDHRRCVFVGNLGFVDDETVLNVKTDEEGKEHTEKRKRTKVPMDVEEGLWQTFGKHAGKVESVRVIRDQTTRVGKGIAYVQFYDGNSVESALLLNGKKFPPMLPRGLRVSRCKAPHKTARAMDKKNAEKSVALAASSKGKKGTRYVPKLTAEEQTMAGRAGKLLGHSAAAQARIAKNGGKKRDRTNRGEKKFGKDKKEGAGAVVFKKPEDFVFEGRRASSRDAKPKDLKQKVGKKKAGAKPKRKTAR
ncbi:nucleolar protein 12 [Diaporthe amygdali]|uniref:nucleolar protein 12 n=1 Tax=Phomopsis amygdali TaxID=1214568 RepID=UPI0022FF01C3|nr:nucleolar protein 12 [Diaporthe amygdali]KAJ0121758.1 nucleolar protein 12 [Diaporthe amygdali]